MFLTGIYFASPQPCYSFSYHHQFVCIFHCNVPRLIRAPSQGVGAERELLAATSDDREIQCQADPWPLRGGVPGVA